MEISRSTILNIPWIGHGDFGDEVMGYVLRSYLKEKGARAIIYYEKGVKDIYRDQNDLDITFLHKHETPRIIKKLLDHLYFRKIDVVIIGGGSVLHSRNSIKWKLDIVKKIKKNTRPNKKIFCLAIGVSLGPFEYEEDKVLCAEFLDTMDGVVFRDMYSTHIGKTLSKNSVLLDSLDSSLLLPRLFHDKVNNIASLHPSDVNLVGLIFVQNASDSFFDTQKNLEKFGKIVNYLISKGKRVRLISLYTGPAYKDNELIANLKNQAVDVTKVDTHIFSGDIFRTISQMRECGYIISMRLHGIIFSYLLQIPYLSLGYNQKNTNFCKSVNYPSNMCFDFYNLQSLDPVFEAITVLFDKGNDLFNESKSLEECSKLVERNFDSIFKQPLT